MAVNISLINVGYDKNGEFDFGVSTIVNEIGLEKMNKLREMTMVAIGIAEEEFRKGQQERNPASTEQLKEQ